MKFKWSRFFCMTLVLLFAATTANAKLIVKIDAPKQAGKKAIIKLTMKNTFKEKVESARAQVFLMDDQGKVVGQAARWVIGGTKDKAGLAAESEATFNFVIETDKPFTTTKVSFTRIVLEGGKIADMKNAYEIQK